MTITDKSERDPIINVLRIGHGTLESSDLQKSRRFYEEVLGFEVIQTSHNSLLMRKGTEHTYVVVKGAAKRHPMGLLQHNGLDVASADEVDRAFAILQEVKEDYGLGSIRKPTHAHGDYSFYFTDCDDNWWEITATHPGGYAQDFGDPGADVWDLTGLHVFDDLKGNAQELHTHSPEFRAWAKERLSAGE